MGFISDVKDFMKDVRIWQERQSSQRNMIEILIEQNKDLMDRLMASDFEKFKIYDRDGRDIFAEGTKQYKFEEDVDNAGEVIELDEVVNSRK